MQVNYTITIDGHSNGKVDVWFQLKEYLSPEQKRQFERIKAAVERAVKEQAVQLELT